MLNKKYIIALATVLVCLFATTAMAQGVKDRMKARVPAIKALLADGTVGENNQGYLEFRGPQKQADIVNGQNTDRRLVYTAIAKKTGTTPDLVGQRRAAQITTKVAPGTWLQNPSGQWYKK